MGKVRGPVTAREVEVLLARASTPTLQAAGELAGISPNVVRSTTARLRAKLGAATDLNAYHMLFKGVRLVTGTETKTIQKLEVEE